MILTFFKNFHCGCKQDGWSFCLSMPKLMENYSFVVSSWAAAIWRTYGWTPVLSLSWEVLKEQSTHSFCNLCHGCQLCFCGDVFSLPCLLWKSLLIFIEYFFYLRRPISRFPCSVWIALKIYFLLLYCMCKSFFHEKALKFLLYTESILAIYTFFYSLSFFFKKNSFYVVVRGFFVNVCVFIFVLYFVFLTVFCHYFKRIHF